MTTLDTLAFDRATVRTIDKDGRLHIALSNMSKATVNPYRGSEIPGWEALGLDPDRVYRLLRCPVELEAAAPSLNNRPILSKHVPVTARAPMKDLIIGSTGTDAEFVAPYMQNSAVVWDGAYIDKIEDETQKEWSASYHYVADMTPGTYQGLLFDGVMRNIEFNHVALVPEGRAGSDVCVGDSKLETAPMALKSRKALMVRGALTAHLAPLLAADAAMPNLSPLLAQLTRRNFPQQKAAIAAGVTTLAAGKLAADANLDGVVSLLDALEGQNDGEDSADMIVDGTPAPPVTEETPAVDADGDLGARIMARLKGNVPDDLLAEISQMCGSGVAADEDDEDDKVDKPAMDAALKATEKRVRDEQNAIRQAERDVRPVIGELAVACDSAAAVYKLALDHLKVDTTGVDASAYPAMLKLAQRTTAATPAPAFDHAGVADAAGRFAKNFPSARIVQGA